MRGVSIDRLQISSAMVRGLAEFATDQGLNHASLAATVGLQEIDPDREGQFVNLDRFAQLLEIAAILTSDDSFGLRFGWSQKSVRSGPLTLAMLNAPTARVALETMAKYVSSRIDVAHIELAVEPDRAVVEWNFSPLLVRRWQLCDFTASALLSRMSRIIEGTWRPLTVQLVRPQPRNRELFRQILGRSIEFSHHMNAITFPTNLLAARVQNADPDIFAVSCQLLDRIVGDRRLAADIVTSVREEVIQALPTSNGIEIRRVARHLGMSTRSLQRRLADEGTSFNRIVDDTRKALAMRYLEDPGLTFSQIAYQLGFSAPSAFTRASHRWFGKRPGAVRRDLRGALPDPEG